MTGRTLFILFGTAVFLTACRSERHDAKSPADNSQAVTPGTVAERPAAKLPFADNIVAYYRVKQNDELAACRDSKIKLQAENPDADCYDKLDAAFIKTRIIYQNSAVALLSTKNMFGMGKEDEFGVELISLKKGAIVPLWGALGSHFTIGEQNHQLNIHYKTTEYNQPVEKDKIIKF